MDLDQTRSDTIVGIDLGTTNSAVSVYSADTVPTLLSLGGPGKFTVQSCVRWDGGDNFTVGEEAYQERYKSNSIYSVKRIMGSDEKITLTRGSDSLILTPAEVSGIILKEIKQRVAEYYRPCDRCVITVPAYFNQRQIGDTLEAAKLAGWNCLQILKEPTSASYIYSLLGHATNGTVLIYDLGGGTFDVTHMTFLRKDTIPQKLLTSLKKQYGIELKNTTSSDVNDQYFCRVLGTYGDIHLGGDDIDKALGDALIERTGAKLSEEGREKLYLRCEEFKKMGIYGLDFTIEGTKFHVTSTDLDNAVDKIFLKTLNLMEDIDISDVNTIVLVGGSTKSKRLRDNLSKAFPNVEISAVLDPDATVALGAGSVAKAIANENNLMYSDVLPLPIGVLVDGFRVETCIARNTSMPYATTRNYHTVKDNQTQITVHVYQGLSANPAECTYLGRTTITNIPLAPAGEVNVAVSFVLNGQGRLRVISKVDGVDKEEELIIDNIFDVTAQSPIAPNAEEVKETYGGLTANDDFEECFLPLLKDNSEAISLFTARRATKEDSEERREIEDKLVTML